MRLYLHVGSASTRTAARLLDDMSQLVGEQGIAALGSRPIPTSGKRHIRAHRESVGSLGVCRPCGPSITPHPDLAEVVCKERAEALRDFWCEWTVLGVLRLAPRRRSAGYRERILGHGRTTSRDLATWNASTFLLRGSQVDRHSAVTAPTKAYAWDCPQFG